MKLIPLTKDKFAQVDNEMFEILNRYKWISACDKTFDSERWYAVRFDNKEKKTITMHSMVIGGTKTGFIIDHKDNYGLNNQRFNLRYATPAQNAMNRKKITNGKYKGVKTSPSGLRHEVRIGINKKSIYLGSFSNIDEAAQKYNEAALKYHGEFASINEILKP